MYKNMHLYKLQRPRGQDKQGRPAIFLCSADENHALVWTGTTVGNKAKGQILRLHLNGNQNSSIFYLADIEKVETKDFIGKWTRKNDPEQKNWVTLEQQESLLDNFATLTKREPPFQKLKRRKTFIEEGKIQTKYIEIIEQKNQALKKNNNELKNSNQNLKNQRNENVETIKTIKIENKNDNKIIQNQTRKIEELKKQIEQVRAKNTNLLLKIENENHEKEKNKPQPEKQSSSEYEQ